MKIYKLLDLRARKCLFVSIHLTPDFKYQSNIIIDKFTEA